jgi:ubiquitin-associated SH3 domain-containing protein
MAPADWELRLYSCDAKLSPKDIDVYRVSYAHVPREEDELELMAGDLVYINKDEARMASDPESTHSDGWVLGTSWLTGSTGFLPKNYVERTAEANACTLHLTIPLNGQEQLTKNVSSNVSASNFLELRRAPEKQSLLSLSSASSLEERLRETATLLPPAPQQSQSELSSCSDIPNLSQHSTQTVPLKEENYCPEESDAPNASSEAISNEEKVTNVVEEYGPRQIYVVRHGERVDFTFGTWIPYSFDVKTHAYTRKDLNMPLKENIPSRLGGPEMFAKDCPLTRIGCIQARLTGEAMRDNGNSVSHVYVSPSLRCIQTAHYLLQGLGKLDLKLHIEPGLFEWLAWYQDVMPNWMSIPDLGNTYNLYLFNNL